LLDRGWEEVDVVEEEGAVGGGGIEVVEEGVWGGDLAGVEDGEGA
jgi:hypothetical protein